MPPLDRNATTWLSTADGTANVGGACCAEVIAAKSEAILAAEAEFTTLQVMNRNMAERQLMDALEDSESTPLPPVILNRIAVDRMDRTGYGRHTTTTNVNIGFAAKLEAAITRSRKLAVE